MRDRLAQPRTLRAWTLLRRLPVLLGAGLLAFCWAFLGWNATAGSLDPALRLKVTFPYGFLDQAPPVLSWQALLDGTYQRLTANRIGTFSPIYHKAVRWKNQIYYSLLGMAGEPTLLIGPGHQLLETPYAHEYCTRDAAEFAARADREAQRIRALQDVIEARGQIFVYLLTPAKPGVYPDTIPPAYPCHAPLADREAKLPLWRAALHRAGVHVADAAAAVYAARASAPTRLFPQGGTHWNRLGAAIGAQALVSAINAQRKLIVPFTYGVTTSMTPSPSDRDLYMLLNLVERDPHYLVPVLTYQRAGPAGACPPPARITEISGSFVLELDFALTDAPCPPEVNLWFYWDVKHFHFPLRAGATLAVNPAERAEDLRTAQVVVLEENEMLLPGTSHAQHLMDALLPRTAASAR
jgi:alginate O-acetyltransferase complex protein AlgJ